MVQLQKTISKTAETIEERRKAFFENPSDIETIHRFRTNSRTLRSLLAFIKPWQNSAQNAETQSILRDIVRHTSRLRELDVFEKQARANSGSSPELLSFCKAEAAAERSTVLQVLKSKHITKAFERSMESAKNIAWKKRILRHGLPESVVRARFDTLIESVSADLAHIRLSDAEQTHDVRKRAKRARYVSEFNVGVLGTDAVEIAKDMTAHQDILGDVCDARANIRLINEFLERDLPEAIVWELTLMRAQNETFLYGTLRDNEKG
jgi:CHAD domain-containing protein